MNTTIHFFHQFDQHRNKAGYDTLLHAFKCGVRPYNNNNTIGVYFNEDDDGYKAFVARPDGVVTETTAYSWDELSQLIHDNI